MSVRGVTGIRASEVRDGMSVGRAGGSGDAAASGVEDGGRYRGREGRRVDRGRGDFVDRCGAVLVSGRRTGRGEAAVGERSGGQHKLLFKLVKL
jgi:hypothetical protein